MESFKRNSNSNVLKIYDCKGSTQNRKVLENPLPVMRDNQCKMVLKDLDFLAIEKTLKLQKQCMKAPLVEQI
jgi:hypothetical protein